MKDLEQIEERITRAEIGSTAVSDHIGGLVFSSFGEVLQFANIMASSKGGVPKHLRGDTGACLRIIVQAVEWRMSPYGVADKSYFVNDKIAFESQLIHAVVEARAPLERRLGCSYEGEGGDRQCIITGQIKGEAAPLIYRTPKLKDIKVRNSPLWSQDPDQQLWYYGTRAWARRFVPDVLLGIYSKDELEDDGDHTGPDKAKDITPRPAIGDRLKGNKGRGFDARHVDKETAPASVAAAEGAKAGEHVLEREPAPEKSETISPAGTPMEVPDAYAAGAEAKRHGKPMEYPPEIAGDGFAAHRDAFKAGYDSAAVAA